MGNKKMKKQQKMFSRPRKSKKRNQQNNMSGNAERQEPSLAEGPKPETESDPPRELQVDTEAEAEPKAEAEFGTELQMTSHGVMYINQGPGPFRPPRLPPGKFFIYSVEEAAEVEKKEDMWSNFKKLNSFQQTFLEMLLRNGQSKSKDGICFTEEDISWCVSIYNESPESYRLLGTLYTLPDQEFMDAIVREYQIPETESDSESDDNLPGPSHVNRPPKRKASANTNEDPKAPSTFEAVVEKMSQEKPNKPDTTEESDEAPPIHKSRTTNIIEKPQNDNTKQGSEPDDRKNSNNANTKEESGRKKNKQKNTCAQSSSSPAAVNITDNTGIKR